LRELATDSGDSAIDEAYVDFAEYSALALVQEFENVLCCVPCSKGILLAGLRIGFWSEAVERLV